MKLFQRTLFRRFSIYKDISRSKEFKIVTRSSLESPSVAKLLEAKIQATGPISVAEYMKIVSTNPLTGYYMRKDVFGQKGDFITSPEISQMFGEMIGVWIFYELEKIGMPKPWQIIELGPGRGTLMKDILRVLKKLRADDDLSLHLIEISPHLASIQAQILCDDVINIGTLTQEIETNPCYKHSITADGYPIHWYKKIENVPRGFCIIIAHEFFDALPIRKYQKTTNGWREVLITSKTDEKGNLKFEYVLSKTETPILKMLIKDSEVREHIEISPDSAIIGNHIAERLEEQGGFALLIDYGHNGDKTDTFRAFKNHSLHHPLIDPGTADLTADVDFSLLKEVLRKKMLVFGPVEQGKFLLQMGIKERLEMLMKSVPDKNQKDHLLSGYNMIVDKNHMGKRYKCMAAFPQVLKSHLEKYPVAGFHDDINE